MHPIHVGGNYLHVVCLVISTFFFFKLTIFNVKLMILTFCVLNENFHSIGIIYFITNSTHLKIVRICPVFELEKSLMVLIYTFSEPLT